MEGMPSVFEDLGLNRTRASIMELISREPLTIREIAERLKVSQTAVIKNLRILERNGVTERVYENGKRAFRCKGTFFIYETGNDGDEFLTIYINRKGRSMNDKKRVVFSSSSTRVLQDFRLSSAGLS